MNENKAFTLIELLAVIVILAVVALIAIPLVLGVVERVQVASYKQSLRSVFNATDLYITSSEFSGIPQDGINVTDENIRLKNKTFTSGKVIKNEEGNIELEKVSDGYYCGSGTLDNLIVIKGSCDSLDTTPPTITIGSSTVTSNSITIVSNAEDLESGINGYQFSKDNGITWTSKQTSNVLTFTNLTNNTNYTFKVRVYNNNLLSTESTELVVTTSDIPVPTYSIDNSSWTQSAVLTITYPERQAGYIYEYSLDEGVTWVEVPSPAITKDIIFNENGSIIARINDGINKINGSVYTVVNIDTTPPIITVVPEVITIYAGEIYTGAGVSAYDQEEGDISSNVIPTGNVDISTSGSYTIIYNVTDTAGNVAIQKTRTVKVKSYEGPFYVSSKGVNGPILAPGMIPIKWNNDMWVNTTADDTDWYDYGTKKWANVKTADGSMWVWIPRYAYKITNGWHSNNAGTIEISFSIEADDTRGGIITLDTSDTANASNNKWTNHPAFTFGNNELTGIWIAKFEASNCGTNSVKILPNEVSCTDMTVDEIFTLSRSLESNSIYGWSNSGIDIDTHMMKNTEWGAVAYLSHSIYGKNGEVWINPNSNHITGCAGDSASAAATTICNSYETINGVKTSTTGNIYGIYDMSGNSTEYVAGYVNNGSSNLNTYGSSLISAASKYKDVYDVTSDTRESNYNNAINKKGDAIYETSISYSEFYSWYDDASYMPYSTVPFMRRGDSYPNTTEAGIFNLWSHYGYGGINFSFRPTIIIAEGI